jgi:DNA adenine methylase
MINEITSPPVRYTGGKWNLAPWIISHFPSHTCYVEPFCGGASILFRKDPSVSEVINDLNGDVVNFFQVLRTREVEFIRAIDLTPHSRAEFNQAYEPSDDPFERARRFYIRSHQTFGSGEGERSRSWRYEINGDFLIGRWNKTSHLWACARRLKNVHIESDTAGAIIARFDSPNTLFYVDPPYVHSTRVASNHYRFEMDDSEHIALAKQLNSVEGMVVLSGYDCELYRDLYAGWGFTSIEANTVQKTVNRTECLWINPAAQSRQSQKRLF